MATKKPEKKSGERRIEIDIKNAEGGYDSYVFDTSAMLFQQNEEVEKVLASIGYQEMMASFFSEGGGASIVEKTVDKVDSSDDKNAEMEKPKASKDDVRSGLKVTAVLAKLHQKLVASGLRGKLVCLLLVPAGEEWSPATPKIIEQQVLPKLKTEQVESIISCFFSFDKLLRSGFPTYLMGSQ